MDPIKDILDAAQLSGLSSEEAAGKLRDEGFNELPSSRKKTTWKIALEVVREPMFLLLLTCGSLYLFLGEKQEAAMLLSFVAVVMGITIYQEQKTERALEALRDLSSPRALVIRDGEQKRIPGREVVRGDLVLVADGDRVPADGRLAAGVNLLADESMLTGESVPVRKHPGGGSEATGRPGGDDLPFLYSGTLIVQGRGVIEITSTGLQTEMGKIGKAIQGVEIEGTLLQKEMGRIVRQFSTVGFLLCAVVVVVYGLVHGDWMDGILAGLALAMATLPEEFPVVLTIFLALGAWRISQNGVLTRRVPAVETLGAASVLCVDKTGTLTQNRMTVKRLCIGGDFEDLRAGDTRLPERCHALVEYGILSSQKDPFDPMEKAIRTLGEKRLAGTEHLHDNWTLVREYPLAPDLLAMSHVWNSPDGNEYVIAAKGAPEAIFDLCHLDDGPRDRAIEWVSAMAGEGLRVLGVARCLIGKERLPEHQHDFPFDFIGLLGLADPIRPDVPQAVAECTQAGIRVVMITGDYPVTAGHIARDVGLPDPESVVTGPELDVMDEATLQERIGSTQVFARAVPEQKLRIVNALKALGRVVAMTGDGVNDAPALKSAHIGIAMGERGTDVARESAALVLVHDDFSSIVKAVRMGRRIFDNIKKALAFIVSVHVPIAGMSVLPVFFADWPLLLMPVHIVFLELIIDPACTLVFEAEHEESDIMSRPPRDPSRPLFDRTTVLISILQGLSVLAVVLTVFLFGWKLGGDVDNARALAFATLVVANLGLILTNRSWTRTIFFPRYVPNRALRWVISGALAMLVLVIYTPFLRDLFHFHVLHAGDILLCLAAGMASIAWFELLKWRRGRAVVS